MASEIVGKKRKKYFKLPVHVVENHNEILPHIHRAIGAGYLPFQEVAMVHLDSHPDMLISQELLAKDSFDKEKLYQGVSIENWLMPLVFAGHLDRLAWVKPPWADQMCDGRRTITVGCNKETETIGVNIPESYFLSELLWAPDSDLSDGKLLQFNVKTIPYESNLHPNSGEVPCKKSKTDDVSLTNDESVTPSPLLPNLSDDNFILDIDLDFFSTMNPFKTMYTEDQYVIMKKLYAFDVPVSKNEEDLKHCMTSRQKQLDALKKAFYAVDCDKEPDTSGFKGELFRKLVDSLKAQPPRDVLDKSEDGGLNAKTDWKWVHEAGCTCDDTELPHHVSDLNTIKKLMENVKKMLKCLPKPTIVTISRSSEDDYCPPDQVDGIQSQVVHMLTELYGNLDLKMHYKEDE